MVKTSVRDRILHEEENLKRGHVFKSLQAGIAELDVGQPQPAQLG
jgi:hypothetical protein